MDIHGIFTIRAYNKVESSAGLIWVKHMGKGSIKLKALGRFLFNFFPMIPLEVFCLLGNMGKK
jgi:hypothetical protein